jgi:hypothetical protein
MATGAYDSNGIWQYGEDDLLAQPDWSGYMNLGQQSVSDAFTRPATQYKAVGVRAGLAASTWHDLPFDTIVATQGTTPWALANVGVNYRVQVSVAGFYRISATASLGAATFAIRVINQTTGQVVAQCDMGTTVSNSQSVTAEGYYSVNDELSVQIYYVGGVFSTMTDSAASPTRYTITKA